MTASGASKAAAAAKQNNARESKRNALSPSEAIEAALDSSQSQEAFKRNEIGLEWQRQPFPQPSGYAPGNLVAQATAVSPILRVLALFIHVCKDMKKNFTNAHKP